MPIKIRLIIISLLLIPLMQVSADEIYIPDYSKVYDPERDPFADGDSALQYARETDRRVLMELGGNWCTYCKILDYFIENNPIIKKSLYEKFVILKINVSDENGNEKFLSDLPKTFGYPHYFVTENDGSILYSKDTTQLRANGEYSEELFIGFLNEWGPDQGPSVAVAPVASSEPVEK